MEVQESTGVTPQSLRSRPEMLTGSGRYLEAFWTLSRGRGQGLSGPLPIAVSEVLAYLTMIEEYSVSERLRILRLIQSLDGAYLDYAASKISKSVPAAPAAKVSAA